MTPEQAVRWEAALVRADRHWATAHRTNPLPPDRLVWLVHATATVQHQQELEHANTRALLARLVEAVAGRWDPHGDPAVQAQAALRELRRIEQYLLSLHNEQGAA